MDNLEEMDSLEEMDKLLEKYNIKNSTRRNRKCEESNHKDRNQNVVKKKIPINKYLGTDVFTGKFYQKFREELTLLLLKFFQKIAEEGNCQTHTIRPAFQNQSEMSQKKKIRGQYHGDEYRYKNPQQYDSKEN